MDLPFDKYTYRARFLPSVITFSPLILGLIVWFPGQDAFRKTLELVIVLSGASTLLSHFGRDFGKRLEPTLFQMWGGKPTSQWLSHRFTRFDGVTLARYHAKLQDLIPHIQIPDLASERANPSHADAVYDTCTSFLREKTRDSKTFPVVLAENINYGFRRNLLGWKPVGIGATILGLISSGIFAVTHRHSEETVFVFGIIGIAVSVIMLALWLFSFKPEWVRLSADSYAERLIRSLDSL